MKKLNVKKEVEFRNQEGEIILIKQKTSTCRINMEDINFIQCEGDLSVIHFVNKRKNVTVSKRLKIFEEELNEYGFIRSAHNTLVNNAQIHELKNGKDRLLVMKNNELAPLSRRKTSKTKLYLNSKNNHL